MTTPEIDAYNERLNPLGYEIELFNGTYHLGRPGTTRELWLTSTEQVEAQISALENGNQWRLEFESGAVDINRENGDITPHDGSKSYNASIANMYGGRRSIHDSALPRHAEFIQITSTEHPPYGGNWHKLPR